MTVFLLQKIPIMLLHFMGKPWKAEGFEKKPQNDYLRKNNIEVNVWFSCNQSCLYLSSIFSSVIPATKSKEKLISPDFYLL